MNKFVFPKPKDEDIFEDLVRDVYSRVFNNRNFQRYGRKGQKQFGVDSAGFSEEKLIGIQCKNHPEAEIGTNEIDEEVKKSETFRPKLDEYIIVTSADRDAKATKHVIGITRDRIARNEYPVAIKFWQDLCDELVNYPDLVFKYFTRFFSPTDLEKVTLSPGTTVTTLTYPTTLEKLKKTIEKNVGGISVVTPYNLAVSFSTFKNTSFDGLVDLNIQMSDLFGETENPQENFKEAAKILTEIKTLTAGTFFSKDLLVYIQARLSAAFLFGWAFRRVTKYNLKLVFGNQIWSSDGLPYVNPNLYEFPSQFKNDSSDEAVLVLNISRNINDAVNNHVESMNPQPRIVLSYGVDGFAINSPAQALSLSIEIAKKIKVLKDEWKIKKIHLFGALPSALAVLIGYHLNAICPIAFYFMDDARENYRFAGELTNGL